MSEPVIKDLAERALALLPQDAVAWQRDRAALWSNALAGGYLRAYGVLSGITLDDLKCIDRQKSVLTRNTRQFVIGAPANNALLTGARGAGNRR